MITLSFRTLDHSTWDEDFNTPQEAREHFLWFMGNPYDIGTHYAVNKYGDVTCTLDGATWKELGLGDSYD